MKPTSQTYKKEFVERLHRIGMTVYGVAVDEELVSSQGMSFTIIDEGQDPELFKRVEEYLRSQRDCVGPIYFGKLESLDSGSIYTAVQVDSSYAAVMYNDTVIAMCYSDLGIDGLSNARKITYALNYIKAIGK
jgi:hypothetical protein